MGILDAGFNYYTALVGGDPTKTALCPEFPVSCEFELVAFVPTEEQTEVKGGLVYLAPDSFPC